MRKGPGNDAGGAERALEAAQVGSGTGLDHELLGHVRRLSQLQVVTAPRRGEGRKRSRGGE